MSLFKNLLNNFADDAKNALNKILDGLESSNKGEDASSNNGSRIDFINSFSNQSQEEQDNTVGRHEPDKTCPACSQKTVYYLGTDYINGNPMTGASDCEVSHNYRCSNCRHQWNSYY